MVSWSKGHFIEIARIISREEELEARKRLCVQFVDIFQYANPRFDQMKFRKACGVESGSM